MLPATYAKTTEKGKCYFCYLCYLKCYPLFPFYTVKEREGNKGNMQNRLFIKERENIIAEYNEGISYDLSRWKRKLLSEVN